MVNYDLFYWIIIFNSWKCYIVVMFSFDAVEGCHYNCLQLVQYPDNKVHGSIMGPIRGQQDPGGPHVGTMNLVIWVTIK